MGKKKETTKQLIINTAIRLISLHGYNATTTALIAKEVGLSETIIFKYFRNKENLLHEIGNLAITQMFENISLIPLIKNIELSKDYPLKDFLRSILLERFRLVEQNFELLKILMVEMQYTEELLVSVKNVLFPKVYEIFAVVEGILVTKLAISPNQAQAILRIITGVFTSFTIQKFFLHIQLSPDQIEAEVEEILSLIEKGVNNGKDGTNQTIPAGGHGL